MFCVEIRYMKWYKGRGSWTSQMMWTQCDCTTEPLDSRIDNAIMSCCDQRIQLGSGHWATVFGTTSIYTLKADAIGNGVVVDVRENYL
jgi:hypothetical protein